MHTLFQYNWQVRSDWFDWCTCIPSEELYRTRTGGVANILQTLFHVIEVEYSWIRGMEGKEDKYYNFKDYNTLEAVIQLSDDFNREILTLLNTDDMDAHVRVPWETEPLKKSDIMRHIIAHEIHHMGQLSIWSRELESKPVSANFIGRTFEPLHK